MQNKLSESNKKILVIALITVVLCFPVFHEIFNDWEHFKQGLLGY